MTTLRHAVQDYIEMRRGLGFKLRETERGLINFVTFLEDNDTPYITTELALAWAQHPSHAQPSSWAKRLGYVRGFARHRSAADPRTQIPPDGLLPFRPKRARPYLYSKEDIKRLLAATLEMPCRYAHCKLEAMDILLPVRIVKRFRPASRRSPEPQASGHRFRCRGADNPRHEIRQNPPGTDAHVNVHRSQELYQTPSAILRGSGGISLSVRVPTG